MRCNVMRLTVVGQRVVGVGTGEAEPGEVVQRRRCRTRVDELPQAEESELREEREQVRSGTVHCQHRDPGSTPHTAMPIGNRRIKRKKTAKSKFKFKKGKESNQSSR